MRDRDQQLDPRLRLGGPDHGPLFAEAPIYHRAARTKDPNGPATYDPDVDEPRLGGQLAAVRALLKTGGWWTVQELAVSVGTGTETSISAKIRTLRHPDFGGHTILRRRRTGTGLWEYRMEVLP